MTRNSYVWGTEYAHTIAENNDFLVLYRDTECSLLASMILLLLYTNNFNYFLVT